MGVTFLELLGERIKLMRKERKMTLADVAGSRLTKGMLSLIENGKANPSMESLQYIAERLNVSVTDLLQEREMDGVSELLDEAEVLYREYVRTFSEEREEEIRHVFKEKLEPLFEKRSINHANYKEVRLFEIYLKGKFAFKEPIDRENIVQLVNDYEELRAYSRLIQTYTFIAMYDFFYGKEYAAVIPCLLKGLEKLEKYEHLIDTLDIIDYYYTLTIVYSAVNDAEMTEKYLEAVMAIWKKKKLVYRHNDFYRFMYYLSLQQGQHEKMGYYLKKMQDFVKLVEDPIEEIMVDVIVLIYSNYVLKDYKKTLAYSHDQYEESLFNLAKPFFHAEQGYAYYMLGDYENAVLKLQSLAIPETNTHPIDLTAIYHGFAVRAISQYKVGNVEEAKRDILYAYHGVEHFHHSMQKDFIKEQYAIIME